MEVKRVIRLIRLPKVAEKVGVSTGTITGWEKKGRFPRRIKLGPRCVVWDEDEIEAFITERRDSQRAMA